MPIITKGNEHLLVKTPTCIETAIPNTTYLERKIHNRITISAFRPHSPMIGDIWKDISTPNYPIQMQCVALANRNIPTSVDQWIPFIEYVIPTIDIHDTLSKLEMIEGLIASLSIFYNQSEFQLLLDGLADIDHTHPEYEDYRSALQDFNRLLQAMEYDLYSNATGQPFIYH
jgi:hypothetical protein